MGWKKTPLKNTGSDHYSLNTENLIFYAQNEAEV